MEDQCWKALIGELNGPIRINDSDRAEPFFELQDGTRGYISYYQTKLRGLYSSFRGECRSNIESGAFKPVHVQDLMGKLKDFFQLDFGMEFPFGPTEYPLTYRGKVVVTSSTSDEPEQMVVHARRWAYGAAIDFLRIEYQELIRTMPGRDGRKVAVVTDFCCDGMINAHPDLFDRGVALGLFKPEDKTAFFHVFGGIGDGRMMDWQGTVFSLSYFIRKINGQFIKKLDVGIWEVVAQLFTVNGKSIFPKSLRHASKGNNEDELLYNVDRLVDDFNRKVRNKR